MDKFKATAKCLNNHKWSVLWWIQTKLDGLLNLSTRIVEPELCPTCKLKWVEVHNEA